MCPDVVTRLRNLLHHIMQWSVAVPSSAALTSIPSISLACCHLIIRSFTWLYPTWLDRVSLIHAICKEWINSQQYQTSPRTGTYDMIHVLGEHYVSLNVSLIQMRYAWDDTMLSSHVHDTIVLSLHQLVLDDTTTIQQQHTTSTLPSVARLYTHVILTYMIQLFTSLIDTEYNPIQLKRHTSTQSQSHSQPLQTSDTISILFSLIHPILRHTNDLLNTCESSTTDIIHRFQCCGMSRILPMSITLLTQALGHVNGDVHQKYIGLLTQSIIKLICKMAPHLDNTTSSFHHGLVTRSLIHLLRHTRRLVNPSHATLASSFTPLARHVFTHIFYEFAGQYDTHKHDDIRMSRREFLRFREQATTSFTPQTNVATGNATTTAATLSTPPQLLTSIATSTSTSPVITSTAPMSSIRGTTTVSLGIQPSATGMPGSSLASLSFIPSSPSSISHSSGGSPIVVSVPSTTGATTTATSTSHAASTSTSTTTTQQQAAAAAHQAEKTNKTVYAKECSEPYG